MAGFPQITIRAVDLFCGAGGLTYGLQQAGIEVVEGVDIDQACKFPYETNTNARFIHKDAEQYEPIDFERALADADFRVLVGCAPCQPFSTYAQGSRGAHPNKWALLERFQTLIKQAHPDIVSMENVAPLAQTSKFENFTSRIRRMGYKVDFRIVDCRHYGAPQTRKRLVFLASKLGIVELIPKTNLSADTWTPVKDVIGQLRPLSAGAVDPHDRLHRACSLSPMNLKRIRASKPGGTWRDWPREMRAQCHVRNSGKTYSSVYGRMELDKPAPTMTGQCFGFGNGRFGHPEQDRAISLREAALLQTFPEDYAFFDPGTKLNIKSVGRMIGNAAPPILGKIIGRSIIEHLVRHTG